MRRKRGHGHKNGVHWSQTPEGRKRMAVIARMRHRGVESTIRKPTEKTDASSTETPELDEATFAYALGHIECWLGTYAASAGVSASTLTSRVGKVLHSKAGR